MHTSVILTVCQLLFQVLDNPHSNIEGQALYDPSFANEINLPKTPQLVKWRSQGNGSRQPSSDLLSITCAMKTNILQPWVCMGGGVKRSHAGKLCGQGSHHPGSCVLC